MIPDSLARGIVKRAPDKTSARQSGDDAICVGCMIILNIGHYSRKYGIYSNELTIVPTKHMEITQVRNICTTYSTTAKRYQ